MKFVLFYHSLVSDWNHGNAHFLRGIVREFREEHGFTGGVIIRTAASGRSKEDIVTDLAYFHQVWTEIRQKMETRRPPAVLFQEQSLVTKLLRDLLTEVGVGWFDLASAPMH